VHQGYGHPGSGQTSNELRGEGKKERTGLEGRVADAGEYVPRDATRDHDGGLRGDRENLVGAEEVASERLSVWDGSSVMKVIIPTK